MDIAAPKIGDFVIVRTPGVAFGGHRGREENPAIITDVEPTPGQPAIAATVFAKGNTFFVSDVRHESDVPDAASTKTWRWPDAG